MLTNWQLFNNNHYYNHYIYNYYIHVIIIITGLIIFLRSYSKLSIESY